MIALGEEEGQKKIQYYLKDYTVSSQGTTVHLTNITNIIIDPPKKLHMTPFHSYNGFRGPRSFTLMIHHRIAAMDPHLFPPNTPLEPCSTWACSPSHTTLTFQSSLHLMLWRKDRSCASGPHDDDPNVAILSHPLVGRDKMAATRQIASLCCLSKL